MILEYTTIKNALDAYLKAWADLKGLNILNNKKDFTSQLAEFIVAAIYDGSLATNNIQKDWDIELKDGCKIQVKSHAKSATNNNRWTPVKYKEDADITRFIIVVFTEYYKLKHFYDVPWAELWQLSNEDKTRRFVRWHKLIAFDRLLDIDFKKQEIIALFS